MYNWECPVVFVGVSKNTVRKTLLRATAAELSWPLPPDLSEEALENRLFPPKTLSPGTDRPIPDWAAIHKELRDHKKFNLTLTQLWIEYKEQHPENGYQLTRFSTLYNDWLGKRDLVMRQNHKAGEKLFVDYTDGPNLVDPATGEIMKTQLFVAVWGTSNFTY